MNWLTKEERQQNEELFYGPSARNRAACSMPRVAESAGHDVGTQTARIVVSQTAINTVRAAKNLMQWGEWATYHFLLNRHIPARYWYHAHRIELILLQHRLKRFLMEV